MGWFVIRCNHGLTFVAHERNLCSLFLWCNYNNVRVKFVIHSSRIPEKGIAFFTCLTMEINVFVTKKSPKFCLKDPLMEVLMPSVSHRLHSDICCYFRIYKWTFYDTSSGPDKSGHKLYFFDISVFISCDYSILLT